MELAKITSKGQITIPVEIRRKLGVKEGDKVLFVEEAGKIYILNSSMEAIKEAQAAFAGEAKNIVTTVTRQSKCNQVAFINGKRYLFQAI
jgi:AbrB family looped-hinge helix DNA binding protein